MSFDSSDESDVSRESYIPNEDLEFRQRKRVKRTKDDIMLGIFGSDDESRQGVSERRAYKRAPDFARAQSQSKDDEIGARTARSSFSTKAATPEKTATTNPVFGTFADDGPGFIPSARPGKSSETPYRSSGAARPLPRAQAADAHKKPEKQEVKLKSSFGARMLAKMGYKEGTGLGSEGTGIINPIQAQQREEGKAGLGGDKKDTSIPSRSKRPGRNGGSKTIPCRSTQEIMSSAPGLDLPQSLHNILQLNDQKRISSNTDSSSLRHGNIDSDIVNGVAEEVDLFASNWKALQDQKFYLKAEIVRTEAELSTAAQDVSDLEALIQETRNCNALHLMVLDDETMLGRIVKQLSLLDCNQKHTNQIASSALAPIMRRIYSSWNPLDMPEYTLPELLSISALLVKKDMGSTSKPTSFDSVMIAIWLPRLTSSLGTEWALLRTQAILDFLHLWEPLITSHVRTRIIELLMMPRLLSIVNVMRLNDHNVLHDIFLWLPYLADDASPLLEALLSRLAAGLAQYDIKDSVIELDAWTSLFGISTIKELAMKYIPDRLIKGFRALAIDRQSEGLKALISATSWIECLDTQTITDILVTNFFPIWKSTLYSWLSGRDIKYAEVAAWYQRWADALPAAVRYQNKVQKELRLALDMMLKSVIGEELPSLPAGPQAPMKKAKIPLQVPREEEVEVTFRDVLDHFCAKHSIVVTPTRKAHVSGSPYLRLSTSATGSGGFMGYLKGDLLMLQLNKSDKVEFVATDLDDLPKLVGN